MRILAIAFADKELASLMAVTFGCRILETVATLPGDLGLIPIAEALKSATSRTGVSRTSSHEVQSHVPRYFSGEITNWPRWPCYSLGFYQDFQSFATDSLKEV